MVACLYCTEEEDSGSKRLLVCFFARKGRNESDSGYLLILQILADHDTVLTNARCSIETRVIS